jgi:mannose-6-phosphate isomerase-like protein (cupin superfamily)
VVSGEGGAYIDGVVYPIHSGPAVLFPKKSIHMLQNRGDGDMKVACFFIPQATMADYTFHEEVIFPE